MGWLQNEMERKKTKRRAKKRRKTFARRCKQVMSTKSTFFDRPISPTLQFNSQAETSHRFKDHYIDGRPSLLYRFFYYLLLRVRYAKVIAV